MTTSAEFQALLTTPEGNHIEFKEAVKSIDLETLVKYCVALANEGGGSFILGVTDKRPRRVVGTHAFPEPGRTEAVLYEQLKQRIQIEEYRHETKRVLIIHIPGRLPGTAWQYKGAYLMRTGDALVPMSDDQLRRIHEETGPDFSAEICSSATFDDLDPAAIDLFRTSWLRKAPRLNVGASPADRLLTDAELLVEGKVTYAALIMLGKKEALGRFLGQAEIIFEYRSGEAPGPAADRREFRCGFFPVLNEIWELINLRNDRQHFQQGLFMMDILTFDERAVREAILNAVSHRDYRNGGSVFIRQFPRKIEIVSPGGFPPGINQENVLWQQNPRNRRISEVLGKCGLVERAGQGFDLIYRECIRQSKRLPDFNRTDQHRVWLTLHGEITDPEFLRFLEEVGRERLATFGIEDFLVIDLIHRDRAVPSYLETRISPLLDNGIIERIGRGRGTKLLLSRRFYRHLGKSGVYTRKKGLDRETNKALIAKHIQDNDAAGTRMEEFRQVLPSHNRSQIQVLLRELVKDKRVHSHGRTKAARWYWGPGGRDCNH